MREIKFRAWDKKRKRMYEVCSLILNQYPRQTNPMVWANLWGRDIIEDKDINLHAENIELMQFTGLKDKNGKEIYDCDVVRYEENDITNNTLMIVLWGSGAVWTLEDGDGDFCEHLSCIAHQIKVIGNIHDNPELLKRE